MRSAGGSSWPLHGLVAVKNLDILFLIVEANVYLSTWANTDTICASHRRHLEGVGGRYYTRYLVVGELMRLGALASGVELIDKARDYISSWPVSLSKFSAAIIETLFSQLASHFIPQTKEKREQSHGISILINQQTQISIIVSTSENIVYRIPANKSEKHCRS